MQWPFRPRRKARLHPATRRPAWVDLVQPDDVTRRLAVLAAEYQAEAAMRHPTEPLPQLHGPRIPGYLDRKAAR